jgi:hypothetical protein
MADYQVDLSKAKMKDLRTLRGLYDGTTTDPEFEELADRIVIGGIDEIPYPEYGALLRAILRAFSESSNPKAPTA